MTKKASNHIQPLEIPRILIQTSKLIAFISTKLITLLTAKLFTTPTKHKVPKRELEMESKSIQKLITIPEIDKKINSYQYGESQKKVLLIHGWSGRGTQLYKIADALLKAGYSTVSFDAPAHGKSPGKTTLMIDFIATILEMDKQYGPFEAAIGHSLGGMSVLNAARKGFVVKQIIIIGSGDKVHDIMNDFISKLELSPTIAVKLRVHLEKKYGEDMDNYSAYKAASEITIPVLVIHDKNDPEVPLSAGINIFEHLKNGEIVVTEGLGHRKILGDSKIISKVVTFIQNGNKN